MKLSCKYVTGSGANDHFIINDTLIYNKQKPERAVGVTPDGNKTKIDKSGDVDLECEDGVQIILTRVNHVSIFKKNLISIGRCILDGWKIWCEGLNTMIMKKGDRTLKFKKIPAMNDNIYYLSAKRVQKGQVQVLETTRKLKMDINEAHEKFDHPCEDLLRKTAKEFGIELTGKLKRCEGCARAKATQKGVSHTFPRIYTSRSMKGLETRK